MTTFDRLFAEALDEMESAFRELEAAHPKPSIITIRGRPQFRFKEKDIRSAILQKLARLQSCLRAASILLKHGYVQEQAILQRAIDETNEDIVFLAYAVVTNKVTPLHREYLEYFWQEEFDDSDDVVESKLRRGMVRRKKIHAYIAGIDAEADPAADTSRGASLRRTLLKTYSGFVHGASPHIMEMYGGTPAHFYTQGMLNTPRIAAHTKDFWNYIYRGLVSHGYAATAFRQATLVNKLMEYQHGFEVRSGKSY